MTYDFVLTTPRDAGGQRSAEKAVALTGAVYPIHLCIYIVYNNKISILIPLVHITATIRYTSLRTTRCI